MIPFRCGLAFGPLQPPEEVQSLRGGSVMDGAPALANWHSPRDAAEFVPWNNRPVKSVINCWATRRFTGAVKSKPCRIPPRSTGPSRRPSAFLIDQSGSMDDPWGLDTQKRKCDAVADAVNRLIANLVLRCAKGRRRARLFPARRNRLRRIAVPYGIRRGAGGADFRAYRAGRRQSAARRDARPPRRRRHRRADRAQCPVPDLVRAERERQHTDDRPHWKRPTNWFKPGARCIR